MLLYFQCEQSQPFSISGESVRNYCERVYFRRRFWLKNVAHFQNDLLYICLFTDFARLKTIYILLDTIDFKLL